MNNTNTNYVPEKLANHGFQNKAGKLVADLPVSTSTPSPAPDSNGALKVRCIETGEVSVHAAARAKKLVDSGKYEFFA